MLQLSHWNISESEHNLKIIEETQSDKSGVAVRLCAEMAQSTLTMGKVTWHSYQFQHAAKRQEIDVNIKQK